MKGSSLFPNGDTTGFHYEQSSRDWHTKYDHVGNDVPYERRVSNGPSQVQVR
ncbi:unnamed protein product [Rhodiola kirilowii]